MIITADKPINFNLMKSESPLKNQSPTGVASKLVTKYRSPKRLSSNKNESIHKDNFVNILPEINKKSKIYFQQNVRNGFNLKDV